MLFAMHIHQPPQQNMITTTYQQAVAKMSMDATDKTCVSVVDRRLLAFVVVVCCLGLLCCFYGREGLYIFLTLHHNRGSYIHKDLFHQRLPKEAMDIGVPVRIL
jgi:uncharacterized membrane protein